MQFNSVDKAAMLSMTGDRVYIGGQPFSCLFDAAGKTVTLYDGQVVTTGPMLTLDSTTAVRITEMVTRIDVDGTEYRATQKLADGAGFVEIELTVDF